MRKKILVLGYGYNKPFIEFGECYTDALTDPATCDLIVFTGGTDVDPAIYGDVPHSKTQRPDTRRDEIETGVFMKAARLGIPMVGICRGAQFLNVMNGGKLIQDVTGHGMNHTMYTSDGQEIQVTSTHHQMMWPNWMACHLLGWAEGLSSHYEVGKPNVKPKLKMSKQDKVIEPEVLWFPESQSLCVQYHPEYMNPDSDGYKYFQQLLKDYVL